MIETFAGPQTLGGAVLISGKKLTFKLAVRIRESGRVVRDAPIVFQALGRAIHGIVNCNGCYHSHIKDGVEMFNKVGVSGIRISMQTVLLEGCVFHNENQNENDANQWNIQMLHGSKKLKSESLFTSKLSLTVQQTVVI